MTITESIIVQSPARFPARADGRLDEGMRAAYDRDGFLILDRFATAEDCAALKERMDDLIADFNPAAVNTAFSSTDQAHGTDRYFLESGGDIRFFFEPGALDAAGGLIRDKTLALNKVGHALHDRDPIFQAFSRSPRLAQLVADLGLAHPLLLQSMYIFKQPHIGAEVGWHQDATFLYTQPISVVGLWMALDDATLQNGCMTALPGAHRGPLRQRFVRKGQSTGMSTLHLMPWPDVQPVALEAPCGTLVVLHGLLPHASGANTSGVSRHAYALHLIEGDAHYPADNWLQPPAVSLRGFR
jgi:phytanoyl-CoA hydroxylase